ncbi:MAG: PocR ligand-binding domain-containing protein [Lachnospiraceae bacterium]|nr:PocR ligand-binding domain-containing protein [Lachnospiraceae bacterium]
MEIRDGEINLTDLIEVDMLQKIQDAFSRMTGMASLTTDRYGVPVTRGSRFTDFCAKYTRRSEVGRRRCELCDKMGAEQALREGVSCAYNCHAGLVDFAAPIMANDQMVGCFIGGQVLIQEPDEEKLRKVAEEIGVDAEEYIRAAERVNIIKRERVEDATRSLQVIANVLSEIAYSKYELYLKNMELEKASRMKSDFLANMSHEIRTPMNAVIGMAEMSLREDLPPRARDYVNQIKASGQTLLTVINDILDFSKIESGKMDINEAVYKPMSMLNDIVNIVATRISNKDVEFLMDVNPELPQELLGDSIRIKQIMINIANNAVKFTQQGLIQLTVDFEWINQDTIELRVTVLDTGRGIKEEDLGKLFQSFQQLDSKRNRNVEGTGLGLAICKQLLVLMHGNIKVQSKYGEGSSFSFSLPQKVIKRNPSISRLPEKTGTAGLIESPFIEGQLRKDLSRMGAEYTALPSEQFLEEVKNSGIKILFVEHSLFTSRVSEFLMENEDMNCIVLIQFKSTRRYDIPNVRVLQKPIYILSLAGILRGENLEKGFYELAEEDFDFIAPEAEVLIVDDNSVNLTVSRGLLEPLRMRIETAGSGKEAIEKIEKKRYDVIFMDHMMPEMDGVETTHIIRRMLGRNGEVPIIALSANAVDGVQEMFIQEGMNDFVAKPIELKVITAKLKRWLPAEKIVKGSRGKPETGTGIQIPELDTESALDLLGSEKLFLAVLKEYYRVIDKKSSLIETYEQKEQWKEYAIEVHALKSASRQIGARELANLAERMETAGNAEDADAVHRCTPMLLEQYRAYRKILAVFFDETEVSEGEKRKITADILAQHFCDMRAAMDDLDSDRMEEVIAEMEQYVLDDVQKPLFEKLRSAVEDIDTEKCEEILNEWEKKEEAFG